MRLRALYKCMVKVITRFSLLENPLLPEPQLSPEIEAEVFLTFTGKTGKKRLPLFVIKKADLFNPRLSKKSSDP